MPSSNINHIYILVNSQVESKVLDVGDLLSKGLSVSKNEGHVYTENRKTDSSVKCIYWVKILKVKISTFYFEEYDNILHKEKQKEIKFQSSI